MQYPSLSSVTGNGSKITDMVTKRWLRFALRVFLLPNSAFPASNLDCVFERRYHILPKPLVLGSL